MESGPIISWQIDRETVTDFIFLGSKITADGDCSHEIKRCLLLWRKAMTNLDSILKSRDITLQTKLSLVKDVVFQVVMFWCEKLKVKLAQSWPTLCVPMDYIVHGILQPRILEWVAFPLSRGSPQPRDWTQVSHISDDSLPAKPQGKFNTGVDYKESWALENWCFWTVMLEKTLDSPFDCKEIKSVSLKGNQSWIFIGRTDAKAETPILWPPDVKNWFFGKDPDTGKDWRQEETREDDMVEWYHWLEGHEFEQGSLACYSPWGHKESDMIDWLNWTEYCTDAFEALWSVGEEIGKENRGTYFWVEISQIPLKREREFQKADLHEAVMQTKQKWTHLVFNAGLYFFCSWNLEPFLQLKIYRNQNGLGKQVLGWAPGVLWFYRALACLGCVRLRKNSFSL